MLSAVLSALVAVTRVLWGVQDWVIDPSVDPRTREENLEFLYFLVSLFLMYFPFTVLAGYVGGKLGGRLRR
jgi:hypothetical protein